MPSTSHNCHLNLIVALASPICLDVFLRRHNSQSPPPLNEIKRCHRHQMPSPPPPFNAISIPCCRHRRRRHCHHHCHQTTTATTATNIVELTVVFCQRKSNSIITTSIPMTTTNVKTLTSLDNLDLSSLSTVFEVFNVGQGNLAIGKLAA
jgi:hypothetical protein